MKSRTDTACNECMNNKVCARLNRPEKIVNAISDFNPEDDNGIDIVVSCINFERPWNQTIREINTSLYDKSVRK